MNDSRMHGEVLRTKAVDPLDQVPHPEGPNPCPSLTAAEYAALKHSIEADGYIPAFPVLISAGPACEGQIIDGFHRSAICVELGIEPVRLHHPVATELEFKILQIKANLERRQLTTAQRAMLAARLVPLYEERAKARMLAGKAASDPTAPGQQGPSESGTAAKMAADAAGVSERTVYRMQAILEDEKADKLTDAIAAGRSIKAVYESIRPAAQQSAIDESIDREAQAAAEIAETVSLLSEDDKVITYDNARERAAADLVRLATEIDRHIQKHALVPDEVADLKSRAHTFRGVATRLTDFFTSLGDVL